MKKLSDAGMRAGGGAAGPLFKSVFGTVQDTTGLLAGFKEQGAASQEAAQAVGPTASHGRARCLEALKRNGPLSADQVAEELGESVLYVRPRMSELLRQGRIGKTGLRTRNSSGLSAAVWRAVEDV